MHTPAAYGQWSVFDHNGDNQSVVLGTRYGIWWPWYGQFEVGWLQPIQLWLGAGTFSVAPVLVSQDRDLCHVQLHPTWFEPTSECKSWPVVSYLYSGHLPVGLYLGRGSLLLVGPLFHFRQCHSGLVPSRNEHVCPCHSMTRAHGMRINCTFYIYHTLVKQPIIKNSWSVYYHCIVKYIVVFMGLHWIFESREFPNHTFLSGNTFGNNVHVSGNISDPWNKVYDMCLWQARYISIFHYHIRVLNGDFPLKQNSDMNNPWHNHALHADLTIPNINWIVIITHDSDSHHFFCRENTGMWDISRCYWNCYPTENASWEQTDHIFL